MYQPSGTQTFLVQLSQMKQIHLEKDERHDMTMWSF